MKRIHALLLSVITILVSVLCLIPTTEKKSDSKIIYESDSNAKATYYREPFTLENSLNYSGIDADYIISYSCSDLLTKAVYRGFEISKITIKNNKIVVYEVAKKL